MKKLALLLCLIIIAIISLSGCMENASAGDTFANFEFLCKHEGSDWEFIYYKDTETNIIYVFSSKSKDGFSVYYNEDGTPMTYKQFQKLHMKKYHNGK